EVRPLLAVSRGSDERRRPLRPMRGRRQQHVRRRAADGVTVGRGWQMVGGGLRVVHNGAQEDILNMALKTKVIKKAAKKKAEELIEKASDAAKDAKKKIV